MVHSVRPSGPQSGGTKYGPHGLNWMELNTTLIISIWWNSIQTSRPQSNGTQYGPHGINP
ncbi:hypothetical protein HAX54_040570, partial [Datura stramonium]|nr:hypothetical protein [Datura stramonium]